MDGDQTDLWRPVITAALLVGGGFVLYSQIPPNLRPFVVMVVGPPAVLLAIWWLARLSVTVGSS